MFKASLTVGRVRGIPLRLHVSLLLIIPYVSLLVSEELPLVAAQMGIDPAHFRLPLAVWGLLLSTAIFASVALHELGHALVALAQGGRVRGITLMVLGGVTEIDHEGARPWQQLWMAFAGPLVSFALALSAYLLLWIPHLPVEIYPVLVEFGRVNLVLGVFNLIPAYPLDGGRILRALLNTRLSAAVSTRIAALVGRGFALVAVGLAVVFGQPMLLLVAIFVYFGAGVEEAALTMRTRLAGLVAGQALLTQVASVEPSRPVAAVAQHMLAQGAQCVVVRDQLGVYGALVPAQLGRGLGAVGELLRGSPLFASVGDDLGEVARRLQRSPQHGVIVLDDFNTMVGLVTHDTLRHAVALRTAAAGEPRSGAGQRSPSSIR